METATVGKPGVLDARSLVGTVRRFGRTGPMYEITGVGNATPDGDVLLRISVLLSGEKLDYPFLQAIRDPQVD